MVASESRVHFKCLVVFVLEQSKTKYVAGPAAMTGGGDRGCKTCKTSDGFWFAEPSQICSHLLAFCSVRATDRCAESLEKVACGGR